MRIILKQNEVKNVFHENVLRCVVEYLDSETGGNSADPRVAMDTSCVWRFNNPVYCLAL